MSWSSFCGRSRPGSVFRAAGGVGTLALVAAACSSGHPSAAASHSTSPMPEMSSSMPMASPSMSMGGGMLPMGARHMHVTIVSPASGTKVTGNSVVVHVRVSGYKDTCALAGRPLMGAMEATATGHYHVLLDGSLINMFCTPTATVSLQNVKPGTHTLTVVPALDDHAQVTANARSITLDYAPAGPLPTVTGMMGMGGMMGMSCSHVIHVSTAGLMPGSTHTLIALLVDNQHVPLMPLVAARVNVRIGK